MGKVTVIMPSRGISDVRGEEPCSSKSLFLDMVWKSVHMFQMSCVFRCMCMSVVYVCVHACLCVSVYLCDLLVHTSDSDILDEHNKFQNYMSLTTILIFHLVRVAKLALTGLRDHRAGLKLNYPVQTSD